LIQQTISASSAGKDQSTQWQRGAGRRGKSEPTRTTFRRTPLTWEELVLVERAVNVVVVAPAPRLAPRRKPEDKPVPGKDSKILLAQALLANQERAYDKARKLFETSLAAQPQVETFSRRPS